MKVAIVLAATILAVAGCKTPDVPVIPTTPLVAGSPEQLTVDNVLVIVDSSGSMSRKMLFPEQKALLKAFVRSMPDGSYNAGQISFGGYERQVVEVASYDRDRMVDAVTELTFLDESTQLDRVLTEARGSMANRKGSLAVVVFSDGRPTAPGGWRAVPEETIAAAMDLVTGREDRVCFFTVHTSDETEGVEFMERLSKVTDCGAFERSTRLNDVAAIHDFERKIFMSGVPAVAAAGLDTDGDGVPDARDRCPGTRKGARVFNDGCYFAMPIYFPFGSVDLADEYQDRLDVVSDIMENNPETMLRIEGFSDSSGDPRFNQYLSEERARTARRYLLVKGIEPTRVEVHGHGEDNPPYANDTRENRAANRRVEFYLR